MRSINMGNNFFEADLLSRLNYTEEASGEFTLVDVGVHVGSFSKRFASKGWQVVAFEPEPNNYSRWLSTLHLLKKAICVNKAVDEQNTYAKPLYVNNEHWGIHSFEPFHPTHNKGILVESVRLDDYLEKLNVSHVTLLKVDIEGVDLMALHSFNFFDLRPSLVMGEFMVPRSQSYFNYSNHDVVKYLKIYYYVPYVFEWDVIKEYGRESDSNAKHNFLGWQRYPLDHTPAWGKLMFVRPDFSRQYKREVMQYRISLPIAGIYSKLRKFVRSMG